VGPKAKRLKMERPAFYAARPGGWRDLWTILHPPYTAWHLSYVVIGACLAPNTDGTRLLATVLAFFCAVGIAAHALDELHGRPLRTTIPNAWLVGLGAGGLAIACALGVAGVATVGFGLLAFVAIGPLLVLGYNLELFGGWMHTDLGFAVAWGAFPVLVGYFVQAERLDLTAVFGATAALAFSLAQRSLSTPARAVRRSVSCIDGSMTMHDGSVHVLDGPVLLAPLERALSSLSWAMVALALALTATRVF
jgi:hypothetical protein